MVTRFIRQALFAFQPITLQWATVKIVYRFVAQNLLICLLQLSYMQLQIYYIFESKVKV